MIIEVRRRTHIQRITYEEFEQRIRDGELDADTFIRFELITGDEFRPAGELELYQTLADPRRMTFRRNLSVAGIPIVTALLVGLQIRIYLSSKVPGGSLWLQEYLTNWTPAVLELGETWRLLTYGVLHVGFTHLLFNLCFLAYSGYHLERALGRANLLVIYFGSVFTGGMLSMAMGPDRRSLGASGGDFGLLAAAVVLGWKHWDDIPPRARKYFGWALVPYIAVSIFTGIDSENVDNWSHLGGLIGGMVLMTVLDPEVLPGRAAVNQRWRWAAGALCVFAMGGLHTRGVNFVPLEPQETSGWAVSRPGYWKEGWTFTGDRGWFSPTLQATVAATTTVHPRPLSADDAVENVLARIGSGGKPPEVLSREPLDFDAGPAERVELHTTVDGHPRRIVALVVVRGVFEHRVLFQVDQKHEERYRPLIDRVFESIEISDPEELAAARKKTGTHPRSWSPAKELGDALYRAGQPHTALDAYARAHTLAPGQRQPLVGTLRVYADYGVEGGLPVAREALEARAHEPDVVVAAADVLWEEGHEDEAIAALDAAWATFPGDWTVRGARLSRGLPVALPEADDDLEGLAPLELIDPADPVDPAEPVEPADSGPELPQDP